MHGLAAATHSSLRMASPRYVDRDDVDSAAMLGAALGPHSKHKVIWDDIGPWDQLPFVVHRFALGPESDNVAPNGFRTVRCPGGLSCARCTEGRGGYQFRWISPLWTESYSTLARPGSWKPGDSEVRWRRPLPTLGSEGQVAQPQT